MALFDPRQFDPNYYQGGGLLGNGVGLMPQVTPSDGYPSSTPVSDWLEKLFRGPKQGPAQQAFPESGAQPVALSGMMSPQGTYSFGSPEVQPAPLAPATKPSPPLMGNIGGVSYPIFGQPDPATIPQAARPAGPAQPQATPQAAPPAAPQQSTFGGIGDSLSAGFQGMANAKNPMQALGNLVGGLATGQRMDPAGMAQQNQAKMAQAIYGALLQRGMPHDQAVGIASAAATDPKLAEVLLPQALGLKPPATVEGVIAERLSRQGIGGQPNVKTGTVPQANDPYLELKKLKQAEAEGSNAGKAIGETEGAAVMNLPSALAQAQEALRLAGELRTHKGRDSVFWHSGVSSYLPDSAIPGNSYARDAVGLLNQIKGGAFLEAFKALKGGGQITEIEGKKATDAIARMDRSQSRAEFDKALSDYEGVIRLGVDRASQQAGQAPPFQFKGNSDWQQVSPGVRIRKVQ